VGLTGPLDPGGGVCDFLVITAESLSFFSAICDKQQTQTKKQKPKQNKAFFYYLHIFVPKSAVL